MRAYLKYHAGEPYPDSNGRNIPNFIPFELDQSFGGQFDTTAQPSQTHNQASEGAYGTNDNTFRYLENGVLFQNPIIPAMTPRSHWFDTIETIQMALEEYLPPKEYSLLDQGPQEIEIYRFFKRAIHQELFTIYYFKISKYGIKRTVKILHMQTISQHYDPGFLWGSEIHAIIKYDHSQEERMILSHFCFCVLNNSYFQNPHRKKPIETIHCTLIPFYNELYNQNKDMVLDTIYEKFKRHPTSFECVKEHPDYASPFVCLSKILLYEIYLTMENTLDDFLMGVENADSFQDAFFLFYGMPDLVCAIIDVSYHLKNRLCNGFPQFVFFKKINKLPRVFLVTNLNYAILPTFTSHTIRCNENDLYHLISFITFEDGEYVTYISMDDNTPGVYFSAFRINQKETYHNFWFLSSPPVFMVFIKTYSNQ